jgi:HPt (histidine-containing phosphotransfer) domain-containing protein
MASLNIAYEAPDNSGGSNLSARRPIDLAHLSSQTMGDKALECEILRLFARQLRQSMRDISQGEPASVIDAAHRLTGSARAVGAFGVAEAARQIEEKGLDAGRLAALHAAVVDVENFIQGLAR